MSNKDLTPEDFRRITEAQLNNPALALKGNDAGTVAKTRAKHFANGSDLLKQVSDTLQQIATTHPDKNAKQQASLALDRLSEAQNAFGNASLCQQIIYQKDDSTT
jgi:uncharacterized protein YpuA (DUF1002 family)